MTIKEYDKDPDAKLDYAINWERWLAGQNIVTSSWVISPDDSNLANEDDSHTTTITMIWISGGAVNQRYVLTNHIVLTNGAMDDRSIGITIKNR